jgi:signal transduction histidine kinase
MIEHRGAERELALHVNQPRALSQVLREAREDERRHLARELHDRVGQNLTELDLNLNVIRNALPPDALTRVSERLGECLRLVEHTVDVASDVMTELRPAVLEDAGLLAALRWQAEQFSGLIGRAARVSGEEPVPPLSSLIQNALLRIAQEALTNVSKYAHGAQVSLTLESSAERVRLIVADEGCGFDSSRLSARAGRRGWGLRIMRERAEAVGARFQVESRPGRGTRVIVDLRR